MVLILAVAARAISQTTATPAIIEEER